MWTRDSWEWGLAVRRIQHLGVQGWGSPGPPPFLPPPMATEAGQTGEVPPSPCHLRLIAWVCPDEGKDQLLPEPDCPASLRGPPPGQLPYLQGRV